MSLDAVNNRPTCFQALRAVFKTGAYVVDVCGALCARMISINRSFA